MVYNGENRPMRWQCGDMMESEGCTYAYALDGNKNISEVVDGNGDVAAHYEYAAFGDAVIVSGEKALANPFRFSSEYADDALGLTYYNYRHLDHAAGRWLSRDPIEEQGGWNLYGLCGNCVLDTVDSHGFKKNTMHHNEDCTASNVGAKRVNVIALWAPGDNNPDYVPRQVVMLSAILLFSDMPIPGITTTADFFVSTWLGASGRNVVLKIIDNRKAVWSLFNRDGRNRIWTKIDCQICECRKGFLSLLGIGSPTYVWTSFEKSDWHECDIARTQIGRKIKKWVSPLLRDDGAIEFYRLERGYNKKLLSQCAEQAMERYRSDE